MYSEFASSYTLLSGRGDGARLGEIGGIVGDVTPMTGGCGDSATEGGAVNGEPVARSICRPFCAMEKRASSDRTLPESASSTSFIFSVRLCESSHSCVSQWHEPLRFKTNVCEMPAYLALVDEFVAKLRLLFLQTVHLHGKLLPKRKP